MMEEIEYKLKKKDPIFVVNAISKLVDAVNSKAESGNVTDLPEFKYLKSKCEDEHPLVSIAACQGLISLVELGVLDVLPTLASLIAVLPSVKNYSGIITCVGKLLVLDLKRCSLQNKPYHCPFSARSLQHPYILILQKDANCWTEVTNQINLILCHSENIVSESSIEMLQPVFLYILCNPTEHASLLMCRRRVWSLLLEHVNQNHVKTFVLQTLCWKQVGVESNLHAVDWMVIQLAECAVRSKDVEYCCALAPTVALLVRHVVRRGSDPRSLLDLICQLLSISSEGSSCVLMLLAETIPSCPIFYLKDLIQTCFSILKGPCNILASKMLAVVLLPWLIYPAYLSGEALEVANRVILHISDKSCSGYQTEQLCANKIFAQLRYADPHVDMVAELCRLSESWQSNPASVTEWLDSCPDQLLEKLSVFISGLFLHDFGMNEIKRASLKMLLKLVNKNSDFATTLVALILYKLAVEKDPPLQMELLAALTSMAVQKENVALILHTFESMKKKSSLRAVSVNLYLKLWKVQNRCYPFLEKLLREVSSEKSVESWEFEVAKASALKEMCQLRPELHGKELVSLLSQILNRCGDTQGSVPSCLVLEGITALCQAEIVDVATTWKALSPKLSRDKRPAVIISLCGFFGAVPGIRSPGPEYQKLVTEAVGRLWLYVSNSDDTNIISAALGALSNFKLEDIALKSLPDCYRRNLTLPSAYAKTPVEAARKPEDVLPYIPGECWIQLLQNVKPGALEAASKMLAAWLSIQLSEYRSGVYHLSGREEPPNYKKLLRDDSICRALVSYLQQNDGNSSQAVEGCFQTLSSKLPKPLPPLNWTFLNDYFVSSRNVSKMAVLVAAKQAKISPSARKLMEMYLGNFSPSLDKIDEILNLFSYLDELCNGVPPKHLQPFAEKCLDFALEKSKEDPSESDKCSQLLKDLLSHVKTSLQKNDIHEANKTMLCLLVEQRCDNFDASDNLFPCYVDCVVELPTKYLERMSSPSVWWEVTPDKLRRSVGIRGALACRADTDVPLVWLNECIDAAINLSGEQLYLLQNISSVMSKCRRHESNCRWMMELLGRIQAVVNSSNETDVKQTTLFLCDVFLLSVIFLSGYNCLAPTTSRVVSARETRLQLFPQSLFRLLSNSPWTDITSQVVEWLHHMKSSDAVLPPYATAFYQSLCMLRHHKYFQRSSVWMETVSLKSHEI